MPGPNTPNPNRTDGCWSADWFHRWAHNDKEDNVQDTGEDRIDIRGIFDNVRRAIRTVGVDRGDTYNDIERRVEYFNRALDEFERAAWTRGWELGTGVAQRNAEDVIAQAALAILGKDRADGEIDLGALGRRYRDITS